MTLLETERVRIRKLTEGDLDALAPMLGDPEVMEFSLKGALERSDAHDYVRRVILDHYDAHGFGMYGLESKETGELLGFAGPVRQEVDGESCVEIAYRLSREQWGKGLATEAVIALCDYAFAHIPTEKLIAIIEPANRKSVRVALKAGFHLAKKTRYHDFDVDIYEVHKSD